MLDQRDISNTIDEISPLDIRIELFKKRNFDFIVKGKDENGKDVEHNKMREVLLALTSNKYEEILSGGSAGNGKSWAGCTWLLFMGLAYPRTRYFISRNELKDLVDSVLVTWGKVCRAYGFTDWKYNAVKNYIQFGEKSGGSHINFIELKRKPSDPMFEDLGSTEYTAGWAEEVSEQDEMGINVIGSRVGRHMNAKYGIKAVVLMTTNPKKNWVKTRFYDRWKNDTLPEDLAYMPSLVTDNPFIEKEYIEKLRKMGSKDKSLYERLFKGNWDYEENPNALCDYEKIEQVFDNDLVEEGTPTITCDAARLGADMAVILVWKGWKVVDKKTFDLSKTTEISDAINIFRRKYKVIKNRVIIDGDGVGGGVIDEVGGISFRNGSKPIKESGDMPNYRNLQVQCLYHLADKVNENGLWIACDLSSKEKEDIKAELDQIQSLTGDYKKLDCKPKSEIKKDLGRSPDWRDTLLMRCYPDLKPNQKIVHRTKQTLSELGVSW